MTEAELTTKHTGELRKRHPTWVVLKHCDRFTSGIPDVSVSLGIRTVWVEYKLLKKDQELIKPRSWVNKLAQLEQCRRLEGLYLAYDHKTDLYLLCSAEALAVAYLTSASSPGVPKAGEGLARLDTILISRLELTI